MATSFNFTLGVWLLIINSAVASPHTLRNLETTLNKMAPADVAEVKKMYGVSNVEYSGFRVHYPYKFTVLANLLPFAKAGKLTITFKSREAGILELQTAPQTLSREHSWLFIPRLEAWIDGTLWGNQIQNLSDGYLLIYLSKLFSDVEMFHTHPDASVEKFYPHSPFVHGAIPSDQDVLMLDKYTTYLPQANLKSSVISHYGVTTFETSPESRQHHNGLFRSDLYYYQGDENRDPVEVIQERLSALQKISYVMTAPKKPGYLFHFVPFTSSPALEAQVRQ